MFHVPKIFVLLGLVGVLGCGVGNDRNDDNPDADAGTDTDIDTDIDTDADSDTDGDTDTGTDGDTDADTDICDEQDIPIWNDPVRVMILIDHSASMSGSKWDIARNAIYNLMDTFAVTSLEFGLDVLPDATDYSCQVAAPVVIDSGPDTETDISDALAAMVTTSTTPIYDAMNAFIDPDYAPGLAANMYDKYLVLVTDGMDSCTSLGTSDFINLTSLLVSMGIKVIVVGFTIDVDPAQLNAIAANGGTDFTTYLDAADETSLNAAFTAIGSSIINCVFNIDAPSASANPDQVNFYFDEDLIPMDDDCSSGSGWHWLDEEHTQVEFCPDTCDLLASGDVEEIRATFGYDTIIE